MSYTGNFFVTRFKIEETGHILGDYLVTLFSFGRFIRQENPSYWFLKIVQTNFSQDMQDESEHFRENIYPKHLTKTVMEAN